MTTADRNSASVALIGAPTDVGAGRRGASMGPEALRVAGLDKALRRLGRGVIDRGNVVGPHNPEQPRAGDYRHLPEVASWCRGVHDAVYESLTAGEIPLLMGGDHSVAIGSVAAVSRFCAERQQAARDVLARRARGLQRRELLAVGQYPRHARQRDRPATGPRELVGLAGFVPMLPANRIVQIGIRSVDAIEKKLVVDSGMVVYDMRRIDELRMRTVMEQALAHVAERDVHLHVSFDVDFLDPSIAPGVPSTVPGGPTYREAQLCMEMIYDSGLMRSLDVMELNPAYDEGNRTAELAVELVQSLFGLQILARTADKYTL